MAQPRNRPAPRASVATTTAEAAPAPRPQMRRTVRVAASEKATERAAEQDAKQKVVWRLQLIAKNNQAIDKAAAENEMLHAEIEKLMKDAKLLGVTDGKMLAEMKDVFSRASRTIKPALFYKMLKLEDFLSCVSVGVTEAKKFLSDNEIDKISDKVDAKKTGTVLSIKEVKTETKRKDK